MKICSGKFGCGQTKPLNEFGIKRVYGSKIHYQTICKSCQVERSKLHYHANKTRYATRNKKRRLSTYARLKSFLESNPCVDCGESDHIVLDFDHVRGEKHLGVIAMVVRGYPWDAIDQEIKKCDVRCANCHRRKTAKQLGYWHTQSPEILEGRTQGESPVLETGHR
jgi:hypothetical protein